VNCENVANKLPQLNIHKTALGSAYADCDGSDCTYFLLREGGSRTRKEAVIRDNCMWPE
jgi:hypothetical protein